MNTNMQGKTALITAAAQGIGRLGRPSLAILAA
jgi:hypothetical protein